ncbi:Mannitol 2-dehydrogenase [Candidatus Protofrankia datiscae]|uniref:Mannitol-1-phosphate 5-dehydrogenase n=1 Tax=Candidatus Protofrankia datiscae TaxID=2716812 RepID=F8B2V6_9ACTN|nr:Mannitol 2-dehydrogenase [Candidatus Protofrankia datiscae]
METATRHHRSTSDVSQNRQTNTAVAADSPFPSLGRTVPSVLTESTVTKLGDRVETPAYDRHALTPSVVHLSVGGFARAHPILYFDDLAATGETGWGVIGVGMRSPAMGEVLRDQDGLYTVVERDRDGASARLVGALIDYLYLPDQPEQVADLLASPNTRLVTLTVTSEGYQTRPDMTTVRHDLATPGNPVTAAGLLVAALRRRRAEGTGPFTVLSCDNLDDSGAATRLAVLEFTGLLDAQTGEDLTSWVRENVTFPNGMVDRITPTTSPELRDQIEGEFGVPDRWPVVTEPFRQWVVEDDFCTERPPLERVGVQVVDDVTPWKVMKGRLLNGGHCALGYLGVLAALETTDQAMAEPVLSEYMSRLLREEIAPLLPELPGQDTDEYVTTTLDRIANPAIGDSLLRLCRRGSTKVPHHVLSSLGEARVAGRPHRLLLAALAGWLRFLRGEDMEGRPLTVEDSRAEDLRRAAHAGGDDPTTLLGFRDIFGDLADDADLVAELGDLLTRASRDGIRSMLAAVLDFDEEVR